MRRRFSSCIWGLAVVAMPFVDGCAGDLGFKNDAAANDDPFSGDSGFTNPDLVEILDAGTVSPDAFFIDDPQPPYCGEDGKMQPAAAVGGTRECPDDKNREGCPCSTPGQQSLCWPGKRVNRSHGVCRDGMTTCQMGFEFGNRWSACVGYKLPVDGATEGADACRCFSAGHWALTNLVPCISQDAQQRYWIYSSRPSGDGSYICDGLTATPPPAPTADWTTSTLEVDCGGRFELCYTIKAGDVANPKASDCVLTRSCVNTWYARPGVEQGLPNLKGWSATDSACTKRFVETGGYGEMTVLGKSTECEPVDDGQGKPYVFKRASYCPPSCADRPDAAECQHCSASGAGDF